MTEPKTRILIAGGGTGGHIYPAIAIARAVQKKYPGADVHFVGASGGLESKIIPRENLPLHLVTIGKLHSSVGRLEQVKTLFKLPVAFLQVVGMMVRLRPKAVLGVGGYASGPALAVAALFRIPTMIWEPNAHPGLTNRILARFVGKCLVVFQEAREMLGGKNVVRVGLPVRSTMSQQSRPPLAARNLRVLVFGGSQGARAINNTMVELVRESGNWLQNIDIIHQTGKADFERIKASLEGFLDRVQVLEYVHDMDQKYAWADVVICRAGASTVAEICACRKAAIFIPLPTAADDHQRKNAESLVKGGAAMMLPQNELSWQKLRDAIESLRKEPQLIEQFETRAGKFHVQGAAEKIADYLCGAEQV